MIQMYVLVLLLNNDYNNYLLKIALQIMICVLCFLLLML